MYMPPVPPSQSSDRDIKDTAEGTDMSPSATQAPDPPLLLKRPIAASIISPRPETDDSSFPSPRDEGDVPSPVPSERQTPETETEEVHESGLDAILVTAVQSMKDRLFVLKLDNQCESFIKDERQTRLEFPHMNSYQRLIIHRIAVHFNLVHVADSARKAVILYKTTESAIPEARLADIALNETAVAPAPMPSIKIMQRHQHHHGRGSRHSSTDSGSESGTGGGPKTIEEREAAYQAARARIFQEDAESDVSSTSRNSGQSGNTSVSKPTKNKSNPRGQVARPRNPQGMPRQRAQQYPMHPAAMPYPMQMADYAGAGHSYYQQPESGNSGGNFIGASQGGRGISRQYPTSYDGLYPSQSHQSHYMNLSIPPPGAYPQGMTPGAPYFDWNGVPYPAHIGMPASVPQRTPRDQQRIPDPAAETYGPSNSYRQQYSGPSGSGYGLNPQAQAFTSQYPSLRSDGVALHYYPNPAEYEAGTRTEGDRSGPSSKLSSKLSNSDADSWANVCRDPPARMSPNDHRGGAHEYLASPETHFRSGGRDQLRDTNLSGGYAEPSGAGSYGSTRPGPGASYQSGNSSLYYPADSRSIHKQHAPSPAELWPTAGAASGGYRNGTSAGFRPPSSAVSNRGPPPGLSSSSSGDGPRRPVGDGGVGVRGYGGGPEVGLNDMSNRSDGDGITHLLLAESLQELQISGSVDTAGAAPKRQAK
ncbi:hypothetical protein DFJ77DRAFT_203003 [Powellomyces hirtus]|nr:hypothetical protein DFJ77DRAFT_203003 [Powellomyces hirtus]